jgi:Phage gp6-like head-tail connector protein
MATYATLQAAKDHLRITDTAHDADVTAKLEQAESIILDYLISGRTRYIDPSLPIPASMGGLIIQSAILELLTGLYEHRGDDFGVDDPDSELWNAVRRKLARLRDPALA